jgi:GGDEF domain-containing protein
LRRRFESIGNLQTVVDVTEHKRLAAELRSLATTDTLTGLPTRR